LLNKWEIFCLDEMKENKNAIGETIYTPTSAAKEALSDIARFNNREDAIKEIVKILRTDR